jgi:hypothetical protein
VRIRDGLDGLGGGWFGECVQKKVGDGTETFFWTDTWIGGTPLCVRFQRLFDLMVNKLSTVAEVFSLGWGVGVETWSGGDSCGLGVTKGQVLSYIVLNISLMK